MLDKEKIDHTGQELVVFLEAWRRKKKRRKVYKIGMCIIMFCLSIGCGVWGYFHLYNQLPSVLRIKAGEEQILDFGLPLTGEVITVSEGGESNIPADKITIDLNQEVTLRMDDSSNYLMNVKLFGCLPFKQVGIQVIGDKELTPAGIPIGLYVETDGLLVIGVGEFEGEDGIHYCPAKSIVKSGDYILACNGQIVTDKDAFIEEVERSDGTDIVLRIRRDGKEQEVSIKPIKNRVGEYKIGIWVRDNAQGVGTLTYIDNEGNFGALGHGVTDVDTSTLMKVEDGTLYQTEIISIKKGRIGTPGEMTGMIVYDENRILGDIDYNGTEGIFGTCNDCAMELCTQKSLPIGLKQEIKKGMAEIFCNIDGESKYYAIEITGIHLDNDNVNRGIEIQVTDPELLELTGGIVQGMSGSPIIQDGKIIGAVTHVLVNDPTRGYGIFIENMLEH